MLLYTKVGVVLHVYRRAAGLPSPCAAVQKSCGVSVTSPALATAPLRGVTAPPSGPWDREVFAASTAAAATTPRRESPTVPGAWTGAPWSELLPVHERPLWPVSRSH